MEEKIICPSCKKEMEINKSPFTDLRCVRCKDCHISITVNNLEDVEYILKHFYHGQWNFEVKYINNIVEHAQIGGGVRPERREEE